MAKFWHTTARAERHSWLTRLYLTGVAAITVQSVNGGMDTNKFIVVLDDDVGMLRAVERGLHVHGYDTAGFSEVMDFLNCASLEEARCLVLDINLKQVSGIDIACQLKRMGHSLPVIFMTASDSEATRRAAVDAGCIAYLTKPFPLANLVEAIEQRLGNLSKRETATGKRHKDW